jgi:hypothetical protein
VLLRKPHAANSVEHVAIETPFDSLGASEIWEHSLRFGREPKNARLAGCVGSLRERVCESVP